MTSIGDAIRAFASGFGPDGANAWRRAGDVDALAYRLLVLDLDERRRRKDFLGITSFTSY